MFSRAELKELSQVDITNIDKSQLVNINDIHIDHNAPVEERAEQFFSQIGNPYCFLVDEIAVIVQFNADGKPISQAIGDYFISLK
jgi:hypothetical protein